MSTFILTYTGREVDPFNLRPEDIAPEDIACGLTHTARFSGQTPRLYSVAEHSLGVAALVPGEHQLQALLHDAPEAYLGDIVAPIKGRPEFEGYRDAEAKAWEAIAKAFDVDIELHESVKRADRLMLAIEARFIAWNESPNARKKAREWTVCEEFSEDEINVAHGILANVHLVRGPHQSAMTIGGVQQRYLGALLSQVDLREMCRRFYAGDF